LAAPLPNRREATYVMPCRLPAPWTAEKIAETTAAHVRADKEAVGAVTFGYDKQSLCIRVGPGLVNVE
jgi:hypothetical protein